MDNLTDALALTARYVLLAAVYYVVVAYPAIKLLRRRR